MFTDWHWFELGKRTNNWNLDFTKAFSQATFAISFSNFLLTFYIWTSFFESQNLISIPPNHFLNNFLGWEKWNSKLKHLNMCLLFFLPTQPIHIWRYCRKKKDSSKASYNLHTPLREILPRGINIIITTNSVHPTPCINLPPLLRC